ncbi:hypothetical protein BX616_003978 [Lobosporangium transversale]|uniref:Uncharacterized protein n=1 Tax=Lobosporangium transversale TaxID=64571 RepID=A0A1Y2H1A5_9FUNG|nr:hypothetical protein BCR41DRAFT_346893 [Lobosporangium transversale]KAF9918943.1 hypothetical protein BX616_003978 [Lobosporangium transversale]ORZ27503.1 hypothetical protein BCR41DRAFT_346893 [Lobosporangium transversale]|eukprot:XP_021885230.1 hypothetical protein BCR41DRAFT_346893 [Lobosporangium transversale]
MDTDQANRQPPLPAKLRWRPYANGSNKKNNTKIKKDDQSRGTRGHAKAMAHKMRGQQYYTGKTQNAPAGIQLQWDEPETIESMSHGGHQYHHPFHNGDRSRDTSPSSSSSGSSSAFSAPATATAKQGIRPTTTNSIFVGNVDNISAGTMQNPVSSLPSPASPNSKLPNTRLDLVGGQSDLTKYMATIPDLTRNTLVQKDAQSLNSMTSDTAYQIALNALFQNQNTRPPSNPFHTPAGYGPNGITNATTTATTNNANAPIINNGITPTTNISVAPIAPSIPTSNIFNPPSLNNVFLSDPNRALTNQELLGVSNIDELLLSCGLAQNNVNNNAHASAFLSNPQTLASPADTDQSYSSSPMPPLLDFRSNRNNVSRATSPSSGAFSPMALTSTAFETLLSQPVVPQQSYQQQGQQPTPQAMSMNTDCNSIKDATYNSLLKELSSPFEYISKSGDSTVSNVPTAWPSLFPNTLSEPDAPLVKATPQPITQRSEIGTQTDGLYQPPLTPLSTETPTSFNGSPLSALGLSEEGLDPDWLSFLDEASPLFNDIETPQPSLSDIEMKTSSQNVNRNPNRTQYDRTFWNWAEQLLKPGAMTPTVSRNGFPGTAPTMTNVIPNGSINNGGLVRTLHGSNQQKNKKSFGSSGNVPGDLTESQGAKTKLESIQAESQNGELDDINGGGNKDDKGVKSNESDKEKASAFERSVVKDKEEDANLVEKRFDGFKGLISLIRSLWISDDDDK